MQRRAVVIGAGGQLGSELVRELTARGFSVDPLDRQALNIVEITEVEQRLASLQPDLVFNAAAYNQVDVAEREPNAALQVNALAVRNLAVVCRQLDARLIHFSTDYVFDGAARQPYREHDLTRPLSAYGVSKLAGEFYARAYCDDALIVRTCGVFGPAGRSTPRGNFVEMMLRLAAKGQPIRVVEDHVGSPTFAPELARLTLDLIDAGLTGIVHGGGEQPISWFDWARTIFAVAGLQPELKPTNEREYRTAAKRPQYSALANARATDAGLRPMPPLRECLERYFALTGVAR